MTAKVCVFFGVGMAWLLTAPAVAFAQLRVSAAQGSTRSLQSQSSSLTTMQGAPGFISAGTIRPFVTGLVPVVGGYGGAAAPVYGPGPLMPVYAPGPSMVQDRIARLRQQGVRLSARSKNEFGHAPPRPATTPKPGNFSSRFAAAQKSTAAQPAESIASIRRRQAEQTSSTP